MVKGETVMPVPGGEITTSEIFVPVVEDVNKSTYCDECQGPLALPDNEEYDSTRLYTRVHSVTCSEAKDDLPELS
jgi:hypothetical protein